MQPRDVIDFWFVEIDQARWFEPTPALDRAIRDRFGALYEQAAAGELDRWRAHPEGCLALCLLLDQFPRNMFRGEARAFATDARARSVAGHALAEGFDRALPKDQLLFLYLPFEHSEDLADQNRSVALFEALGNDGLVDYAVRHQRIVARFGRFPHRNRLLGRATTADEAAFLEEPDSSFGQ